MVMVIILILIGSFGEEPGWRGFALPRLQERQSPLVATIILVVFWWLCHLPAMWVMPSWVDGIRQAGFFTIYGMTLLFLLALGLLTAWVYNKSGGSVLMPILLHASWNFWGSAFGPLIFFPLFFVLWAIVVGIATKGKLGLRST